MLESCTIGDGNIVEPNSSVGSGCTLENACVVGALVKIPDGEALDSCTVVFGSNNSSHVLPRPEEELIKRTKGAIEKELELLHKEFRRIPAIKVRTPNV